MTEQAEQARRIAATNEALASASGSPSELDFALADLFVDHRPPFVLDEDNKDHLVVKDCCGGVVLSSHLPMIGVNVFRQQEHDSARLIARVLVALSKENHRRSGRGPVTAHHIKHRLL